VHVVLACIRAYIDGCNVHDHVCMHVYACGKVCMSKCVQWTSALELSRSFCMKHSLSSRYVCIRGRMHMYACVDACVCTYV
jgi:hypothetical protein